MLTTEVLADVADVLTSACSVKLFGWSAGSLGEGHASDPFSVWLARYGVQCRARSSLRCSASSWSCSASSRSRQALQAYPASMCPLAALHAAWQQGSLYSDSFRKSRLPHFYFGERSRACWWSRSWRCSLFPSTLRCSLVLPAARAGRAGDHAAGAAAAHSDGRPLARLRVAVRAAAGGAQPGGGRRAGPARSGLPRHLSLLLSLRPYPRSAFGLHATNSSTSLATLEAAPALAGRVWALPEAWLTGLN